MEVGNGKSVIYVFGSLLTVYSLGCGASFNTTTKKRRRFVDAVIAINELRKCLLDQSDESDNYDRTNQTKRMKLNEVEENDISLFKNIRFADDNCFLDEFRKAVAAAIPTFDDAIAFMDSLTADIAQENHHGLLLYLQCEKRKMSLKVNLFDRRLAAFAQVFTSTKPDLMAELFNKCLTLVLKLKRALIKLEWALIERFESNT